MECQQDARYLQRALLDEALSKALQNNFTQHKTWSTYLTSHEKVSKALQTFNKDLYVPCLVPIGRRALLHGKLIHTNEVLACLGDGYFAKYSTSGAEALCQRRIKIAKKMLQDLETERDLYESRQIEVDQEAETLDITEHWNDEHVNQWRQKHREKEKAYYKKLSQERQSKELTIDTEDLFQRLDELELQEELYDEFDSHDSCNEEEIAAEELEEEEEDDEEEEEEDIRQILENELRKLKDLRSNNSECKSKSVMFSEPHEVTETSVKENSNNASQLCAEMVRIEFSHTEKPTDTSSGGENIINSPADLCRFFTKPKSILKRSPNDIPRGSVIDLSERFVEEEEEEEEEGETIKPSAYNVVVKDIKERNASLPEISKAKEETSQKRISRFRMERGLGK